MISGKTNGHKVSQRLLKSKTKITQNTGEHLSIWCKHFQASCKLAEDRGDTVCASWSRLWIVQVKARTDFSPPKKSPSSDVLAAPGIQASPCDYRIRERTKIGLEDIKAKVILRMTTYLHPRSKYLSE